MRALLVLAGSLLVLVALACFLWRRPSASDTTSPVAAPAAAAPVETAAPARVVAAEPERSRDAERRSLAEPEVAAPIATPAKTAVVITGRCVDFEGRPLAGVTVARDDPDEPKAQSDADGRFRLAWDGEADGAGRTTLRASAPRIVAAQREVQFQRERENEVGDWPLQRGGVVSGRVVDDRHRAVADAQVWATYGYSIDREVARREDVESADDAVRTDAAGAFRLDSVAPGEVRAWAVKERYLNAIGDVLELRAGEELAGLELVLESEGPEDAAELQVLQPDGTPCAGAQVYCEYEAQNVSGSRFLRCDREGRAHFRWVRGAVHAFSAADRDGRFTDARIDGLQPGHPPIVLRLGDAATARATLTVVDDAGEPVAAPDVVLHTVHERGSSGASLAPGADDPPGRFTFVVPSTRWRIEARARGFEKAELGPFEPGQNPGELRVTLARLHRLFGRVLAEGRPVARAEVALGTAVSLEQTHVVNGFPADRAFRNGSETRTDDDGRFVFYPERSAEYWLRADAPGYAPTIAGPVAYDAHHDREDVDIELTAGGTLVGRVWLPPSEDVAGTIVGVSCGDGHARTVRVGAAGEFRFEHLTPGRWLVKRCDAEISPHSWSSTTRHGTGVELPWNVVVRDGVETRFDLDLRVDDRPRARGVLRIGGEPLAGWNVSASAKNDPWNPRTTYSTDADGRFDVRAPCAGPGTLSFDSSAADQSRRSVEWRGEWGARELVIERDWPAGAVDFARTTIGGDERWFAASWTDPESGLAFEVDFKLAANGVRSAERLPAGTWTISTEDANGASTVVATIEVRANETAKAELP